MTIELLELETVEDYVILGGEWRKILSFQVLSYLKKGYVLYGNPYAIQESEWHEQEHCQAMVKYKPSNSI